MKTRVKVKKENNLDNFVAKKLSVKKLPSLECIPNDSCEEDKIPILKIRRKKTIRNKKTNAEETSFEKFVTFIGKDLPKTDKETPLKNSVVSSSSKLDKTVIIENGNLETNSDIEIIDAPLSSEHTNIQKQNLKHVSIKMRSDDVGSLLQPEILTKSQIDKHIALCNRSSRNMDCDNIYKVLLKKLENANSNKLWNDIFHPKSIEEFGPFNKSKVDFLKSWLTGWKNPKNPKKLKKQTSKKKKPLDSDFDWDSNDEEMNPNARSIGRPLCIITGPTGSGKSSLVYAVADELNFLVKEYNCSNKRNIQKMYNDLENLGNNKHIAYTKTNSSVTVSDMFKRLDVRKRKKTCEDFFKPKVKRARTESVVTKPKPQLPVTEAPISLRNDSVIFFDDFDVVFNDEAGLWSTISGLVTKATRPVVVTCTDRMELTKFLDKHKPRSYLSVDLQCSTRNVAVYMQLLLLTQAKLVGVETLANWTRHNNLRYTDMRGLINNLQFQLANRRLCQEIVTERYCDWSLSQLRICAVDNSLTEPCISPSSIKLNLPDCRTMTQSRVRFLVDAVSELDCRHNQIRRTPHGKVVLQRWANLDRHEDEDSALDSNSSGWELVAEMREEMWRLLSNVAKSELQQVDRGREAVLHSWRQMPIAGGARSSLYDCHERLDRRTALAAIAKSEEVRKQKREQRRFRHYFQKIGFSLSESQMNELQKSID